MSADQLKELLKYRMERPDKAETNKYMYWSNYKKL